MVNAHRTDEPHTTQVIQLGKGVEIHILLVGYVDIEEWEDSLGSNPDADGGYHPENRSLTEDPSVDGQSDNDSNPQGVYGYVSNNSPCDLVYMNTSRISDEYQATDSKDSIMD